eukprot:COSAG02_NODE_5515_length_4268_cov_2.604701_4_plen_218_part_00
MPCHGPIRGLAKADLFLTQWLSRSFDSLHRTTCQRLQVREWCPSGTESAQYGIKRPCTYIDRVRRGDAGAHRDRPAYRTVGFTHWCESEGGGGGERERERQRVTADRQADNERVLWYKGGRVYCAADRARLIAHGLDPLPLTSMTFVHVALNASAVARCRRLSCQRCRWAACQHNRERCSCYAYSDRHHRCDSRRALPATKQSKSPRINCCPSLRGP